MILKQLVVQNFGPFAHPATITIEQDVTVLTGRNDTGKSSVLRLISLLCSRGSAEEDDVNYDRIYSAGGNWRVDTEINCTATFIAKSDFREYFATEFLADGDEVDVKFLLAPNAPEPKVKIGHIEYTTTNRKVVNDIRKMPAVIYLPNEEKINSVIKGETPTRLESQLLTVAFGETGVAKLSNLSDPLFDRQLREGNMRLNETLKRVMPPSMNFEFVLRVLEKNPLRLSLNIEDKQGGYTFFHLRGAGVRRIISLLTSLLDVGQDNRHTLVLIDEPENSLHADAQHFFRSFLEEISTNSAVQVVYATHSPSMINSMRVDNLRLFERATVEGKATSKINNKPFEENFLPVRSSLGISPSDSLLYAPITIIIEGETEALCLPLLLLRFFNESIEGFEDVGHLLSLSHLLDGHGASFEYWCRVAKSQGCAPIIFVDGDQEKLIRQQRVQDEHPDVPIILLKDAGGNAIEFEDIVVKDTYFLALTHTTGEETSLEAFLEWERAAGLPVQMMFSKKVKRWLEEIFPHVYYDKAKVMKEAVRLADLATIDVGPFRELVGHMASRLN